MFSFTIQMEDGRIVPLLQYVISLAITEAIKDICDKKVTFVMFSPIVATLTEIFVQIWQLYYNHSPSWNVWSTSDVNLLVKSSYFV